MEAIETCISFLLSKASQHVSAAAKSRLSAYGVTPVQYAVLKVLWDDDGISGAAIGERLQIDSATITGVIDRLANAGFVERQADAADRRVNRVVLTATGRALHAPLDREMDAVNAEVFAQLSPADGELLRRLLSTIGHVDLPAHRSS